MSVKPGTAVSQPGLGIGSPPAAPSGTIGARILDTIRGPNDVPAVPTRLGVLTAADVEAIALGAPSAEPRLLAFAPRERWFEAWLRGVVLDMVDAARAEASVRTATLDAWPALLVEWKTFESVIACSTGEEIVRLLRAPAEPAEYESLLARALAGDANAAPFLETAAFRRRELLAFRFAHALADGKDSIAKFYQGRLPR